MVFLTYDENYPRCTIVHIFIKHEYCMMKDMEEYDNDEYMMMVCLNNVKNYL